MSKQDRLQAICTLLMFLAIIISFAYMLYKFGFRKW